eukprot:429196_1
MSDLRNHFNIDQQFNFEYVKNKSGQNKQNMDTDKDEFDLLVNRLMKKNNLNKTEFLNQYFNDKVYGNNVDTALTTGANKSNDMGKIKSLSTDNNETVPDYKDETTIKLQRIQSKHNNRDIVDMDNDSDNDNDNEHNVTNDPIGETEIIVELQQLVLNEQKSYKL